MEGMPVSKPGNKVSIAKIPIKKIRLNKNSRLNIDPEELDRLMMSIKEEGLLQPIGVVESEKGDYEICYGNRRFLAVSKLGLHTIPAIVHKSNTQADVDIKNLTENIQRRNISLQEIGRYVGLLGEQGITPREAAVRIGVTPDYINRCLVAFNEIPEEFKSDIQTRVTVGGRLGRRGERNTDGKIPVSTAHEILIAKKSGHINAAQAKTLLKEARDNKNFRTQDTRRYIAALSAGKKNVVNAIRPMKMVQLHFPMYVDDYDRLHDQVVENGPYRSVAQYMKDVLAGRKSGSIKIAQEKLPTYKRMPKKRGSRTHASA